MPKSITHAQAPNDLWMELQLEDSLQHNKHKKTKSLLQVAPWEEELIHVEEVGSGGKAAKPKKKRLKRQW